MSSTSAPGSLAAIVFAVYHCSADVAHQDDKRNRHDERKDGHHIETETERRDSEGKGDGNGETCDGERGDNREEGNLKGRETAIREGRGEKGEEKGEV